MKDYSNKHLTEVVCAFTFSTEDSPVWDVGFYGQYFDKISEIGFTKREDRKGFQIKFSGNIKELSNPTTPVFQETETQMLYRTEDNSQAIILGNKSLSFHVLKNYLNWDNFKNKFMVNGFKAYEDLKLPSKVQTCHFTYLNKFEFNKEDNLSDFFTLIPPTLASLGDERGTTIDTKYQTSTGVIIIIRLFANPIVENKRIVNVECGGFLNLNPGKHITWGEIAEIVHSPIREFFEKIITEKLREKL